MAIYHTLLETFNVVERGSSEQIRAKWQYTNAEAYALRRKNNNVRRVPDKPLISCTSFTYHAPKLFNQLPSKIKKIRDPDLFKKEIKTWIWDCIPAF